MGSGKQVFTGFVTLLMLTGAYFLYAETIGRFTDFPEVTQQDLMPMLDDSPEGESGDELVREANIAAIRAFGPDCPEQDADIKWESRPRELDNAVTGRGIGLFMYISSYKLLEDRRFVRFTPFSLVNIHPTGEGQSETDAIDTVRADEAVIEFDRPVDVTKLSKFKPIGGWVQGNVELKTNRRTADNAADDIVVFTDRMDYSSSRNLIWADDWIRVFSSDVKVNGVGMELGLYPESQEKLKQKADKERGTPAGEEETPERKGDFKYVRLMKNVRFDLQLDNSDDLFGKSGGASGQAAVVEKDNSQQPPKRVPVTITSRGSFHFDSETSQGTFEKAVQMLRRNAPAKPGDPETIDSIDSDRLLLQFKSDEEAKEEKKGPGDNRLVLANATATGREVLLFSDSQHLQATGNYLFYDAEKRIARLQGEKEMIAFHDNTIIHARSLYMEQGDEGIQKLTADGPNGWLEMLAPATGGDKPDTQLKIRWQGRLQTSGKGDGDTQHVVITGNVELEDDQTALKCDLLKVWLVPIETQTPADPNEPGTSRKKTRWEPVKIEAQGNVSASSPELAIVTEELTMDIFRKPMEVAIAEAEKPVQSINAVEKEPAKVEASRPAKKGGPQPVPAEPEPEPKQPLSVRAERVAVVMERQGSKSNPISAWAEGDVFVSQPPRKKEDEPLLIRGQTLHFDRKPQGDVIQVGGSSRLIASIETKDMKLAGKQVTMNEEVNRVEVAGAGYLIRMTNNDLTGKTITKTAEPQQLRIDWTEKMIFDGRLGYFHGDVKAQQGTAEVQCQTMDVTFDRRIIFRDAREGREKGRNGEVKIETVVCDVDVVVRDVVREGRDLTRKTVLEARDLRYDNLYQSTIASGPGRVRIIERNKPKAGSDGKVVPPELPFELTDVRFDGEMRGNQQKETATFYQNIKIVHLPVASEDAPVDEHNLPDEGVFIEANDWAMMGETPLPNGTTRRDFQAEGNVRVHARKYWAQCDRLNFDQGKDQLVFSSRPGNKATFFKQEVAGREPEIFRGVRVLYETKTGNINVDGSDGINNLNIVPKKR